MNTRSSLADSPEGGKRCAYCFNPADTKDHAPPRCLMQPPLPSNLITLPACQKCNNGFSFDENVVRAFIVLVSSHPQLVAERQPGGWLERTCQRSSKLRDMLDASRQQDGSYRLTDSLVASFERVFRKTVQGVFFGLYHRVVAAEDLRLTRVEDRRAVSPEDVITQIRPNPLQDITDEPLSEIRPHSWHTRQPIITLDLQPVSGGPPVRRVFRLLRETPVKWVHFQPGVFSFAFVKCEDEGCACVFEVWQTLVITVTAPWPDGRGPLRRGRKNSLSRDGKRNR
jgi:hypothetical protein